MNARNFILNQLQRGPKRTDELLQMLPKEDRARMFRALRTLYKQGKVRNEEEDVWTLG